MEEKELVNRSGERPLRRPRTGHKKAESRTHCAFRNGNLCEKQVFFPEALITLPKTKNYIVRRYRIKVGAKLG